MIKIYCFVQKFQKSLFLIIALALLDSLVLRADPADPSITRKITLKDGTVEEVKIIGDENYYCWLSVMSKKYFDCDENHVFTDISLSEVKKRKAARVSKTDNNNSMLQLPVKLEYKGAKRQLVILVEFSDLQFRPNHDLFFYDRFFNETNFSEGNFEGSVHDYFLCQSNGQFNLFFDVIGPIRLTKPYSYYGYRESGKGIGDNAKDMVFEAISLIDSQMDFSDYDWNNDGSVEQIGIVFAGLAYNLGGDESTIWPHKGTIEPCFINGMKVADYCCSGELQQIGNQVEINGIGTFCHEFSHCLGLPDTYDGNENAEEAFYGLRSWDLMGGGNHNNNRFTPAGYTALDKMLVGWQSPIVLSKDTTVCNMASMNEHGDFYMIPNNNEPNEFYLLEYRGKDGWDTYQYGKGMLITHIDMDEQFKKGKVNSSLHNSYERYHIVQADNNSDLTYEGYAGDLFPYNGINQFSKRTTPSAILYRANIDGSYYLNKSVKRIRFNGNNTMAFDFYNENSSSESFGMTVLKQNICFVNENSIRLTATVRNNSYITYDMQLGGFCKDELGHQLPGSFPLCNIAPKEVIDVDFIFEKLDPQIQYIIGLFCHPYQEDYNWKAITDDFAFSLDDYEQLSISADNPSIEAINETTVRFYITLTNNSYLPIKDKIYVYVRNANEKSTTGWITNQFITDDLNPFEKKDFFVNIDGLKPFNIYTISVFRRLVNTGKWADKSLLSYYDFFIIPNLISSEITIVPSAFNDSEKCIYNIWGQMVGRLAKNGMLPSLPSGIYIINGKKVFVKN